MSITKITQPFPHPTVIAGTGEGKTEATSLEPYLVITSGLDQGNQYRLHRQFNTLGRSNDTDIKITDAKVSRKHASIVIYPDRIVLEDHQSTNGSFVNDVQIESQIIKSTSRIRLGNTIMKVEYKHANEAESEIELFKAANTDALTNISNRRAFMIRAQEEVSFCIRNNSKIALIMCDVDHFKLTNDNFGHPAGDLVLKELANILNSQMRKEDLLARFGGEEFIMLIRDTNVQFVSLWAERIREKVEQFSFIFEDKKIPTTLSLGICCIKGEKITNLEAVIKRADNALYLAKNNGRNRVEIN